MIRSQRGHLNFFNNFFFVISNSLEKIFKKLFKVNEPTKATSWSLDQRTFKSKNQFIMWRASKFTVVTMSNTRAGYYQQYLYNNFLSMFINIYQYDDCVTPLVYDIQKEEPPSLPMNLFLTSCTRNMLVYILKYVYIFLFV